MQDEKAKPGPLLVGDRPLPHSQEMESAVLSCLLQDPFSTMDGVFSRLENDACMYVPVHRRIYETLREMAREMPPDQIDLIALSDRLSAKGMLDDVGGMERLRVISNTVPSIANLDTYVTAVRRDYFLRNMIGVCSEVAGQCFEAEGDVNDLIDHIERTVLDTTNLRNDEDSRLIKEVLPEAYDYLEKLSKKDPEMMGMRTGFSGLDELITGMKPGEMFVLAARPSIGKTTLAMNLLRNISMLNKAPVAFFSLEMDARQVTTRLICSEAKIDIRKIRDGNLSQSQWRSVVDACGLLGDLEIYIEDTPGLTSTEVRRKTRRLHQQHGLKCIAIDYLQLMRTPDGLGKNSSREQEVARMSNDIKSLAMELKIPIIILAQLNRAAEATGQPKISNLRESGAIEQDADVVALLHRDRETDNDEIRAAVAEGRGIETKLIIAKNRNGPTGVVDLTFYPQWTMFDAAARVDDGDIQE